MEKRARIANLAARKGHSAEQLALIDAVAPVKIQSRGVFGGFILGDVFEGLGVSVRAGRRGMSRKTYEPPLLQCRWIPTQVNFDVYYLFMFDESKRTDRLQRRSRLVLTWSMLPYLFLKRELLKPFLLELEKISNCVEK